MLCFLRLKVSAFSACRAFEEREFTADSTVVYLHKKSSNGKMTND